tara:strand:+ start:490 stop:759 length:270 start_codon:yes stop_codon:yes gene_type:complete
VDALSSLGDYWFMATYKKTSLSISFGAKVRDLRRARGLSQESFALLTGLDRSYMGGVERGERNVSLQNIYKIANALNVSLEFLFKDVYG